MEYDELVHYGVKGMKWGIRRKRKEGSSRSKTSAKSSAEDIQRRIGVGAKKVKQFMKDNGKQIAATSAIIALSAVGVPYAALAIANAARLDLSAFGVGHNRSVERVYERYENSTGTIVEEGDRRWAK